MWNAPDKKFRWTGFVNPTCKTESWKNADKSHDAKAALFWTTAVGTGFLSVFITGSLPCTMDACECNKHLRCCCLFLSLLILHEFSIWVHSSLRKKSLPSFLGFIVLKTGAPLSTNTWQNEFESWACDWNWHVWASSVGDSHLPLKTKSVVTQCQIFSRRGQNKYFMLEYYVFKNESEPVGCSPERRCWRFSCWDEKMQIMKSFRSYLKYRWELYPNCCIGVRWPFFYAT